VVKNVVSPFLFTSTVELSFDPNLSLRQGQFFSKLRITIPPCGLDDRGSDEFGANVSFGKGLFIEHEFQVECSRMRVRTFSDSSAPAGDGLVQAASLI
jgi:hypothetical protein